jgi:hypothetical protein
VKLSALLMLIPLCRQAAAVLPSGLRQVPGQGEDLQRCVGVLCITAFDVQLLARNANSSQQQHVSRAAAAIARQTACVAVVKLPSCCAINSCDDTAEQHQMLCIKYPCFAGTEMPCACCRWGPEPYLERNAVLPNQQRDRTAGHGACSVAAFAVPAAACRQIGMQCC